MPRKSSPPILADEGERLLTMRDVCAITSWSRTSVNRLIEKKAFPQPVKLGDQRIAFRESDVRAYVASRQPRPSGRDQTHAHAA
jgi:predicted DNA-binding transcriptional regulator AlpA